MFEIFKRVTCFSCVELYFGTKAGYIFSFLTYKTLRATARLFFSMFFQSSILIGNLFLPSNIYSKKVLFFVILCRSFFNFLWFSKTFTTYWRHLLSFLFIGFIVTYFFFYLIKRIYIWSTLFKTYFMIFIIQ